MLWAMRPFLLLSTRENDVVADDEYHAFCRHSGLQEEQLHRFRLEQAPLPELNLDDYSGIMLGGSPFNSSDPEESKSELQHRVEFDLAQLLVQIAIRDFPFLGACYGVGTLGQFAGGHVDTTYGEPAGPTEISLTQAGKIDPVCAGMPDTFHAVVGHKEALRTAPPRSVVLARGDACPVQMFRIGRNLYATQFHPEVDVSGIALRLDVYKDHGYVAPDQVDAAVRATEQTDLRFAGLVLRNFVARYARH